MFIVRLLGTKIVLPSFRVSVHTIVRACIIMVKPRLGLLGDTVPNGIDYLLIWEALEYSVATDQEKVKVVF